MGRSGDLVAEMAATHVNRRYLPDFALPRRLAVTSSLSDAVADADLLVMAVPSHGFRDVLRDGAAVVAAVEELARRVGVELPIAEQIAAVINGEKTAAEIIPALMLRQAKAELQGIASDPASSR